MELDYEELPVLDALRACATGEFSKWTLEQHQCLADWVTRHPSAIAGAACTFLDENLPDAVRERLEFERRSPDAAKGPLDGVRFSGNVNTPFGLWLVENGARRE